VTTEERSGARYGVRFAEPQDRDLVIRFNERIANGGLDYEVPLDVRLPGEPQDGESAAAFRKLMLVEDGEEMRAGVVLHHSTVFVDGEERPFCWSLLPISEGAIDRAHSMAILILMKSALEHQSFQMAIGVGSMDEDAAQFFVRLRWRNEPVPFLFYPVRPTRLATGLSYLRRRRSTHLAGLAAAYSGGAAIFGWGWTRRRRRRTKRLAFETTVVPSFDEAADELFGRYRDRYGAVVRRDTAALNVLYPEGDRRYLRLEVRRKGSAEELGWIVAAQKQMDGDRYFGDLNVGTLVDGFGAPDAAPELVAAGLEHLADRGVDVVVANWSHQAWVDASRSAGFLRGPSNFFFFVSPAGSPLLESSCPLQDIHLTRGDGDGPERLLPSEDDPGIA